MLSYNFPFFTLFLQRASVGGTLKFLFQYPCLVSQKTEQKNIIGKFDPFVGYGKRNE